MDLSPLPIQKFWDKDGNPLVAGKLFTYAAGTTTKLGTFQNSAGAGNSNPIILDFRGECSLWLNPTLAYKFVLAPANDTDPPTAPIWTVDNITAGPASMDNAAEDTGSANTVQLSIPRLPSTPSLFDRIVWKSNFQNTGATTIVINGGPAKALVWQNQASLSPLALQVDGVYEAIYDGTRWQLQGPTLSPTEVQTLDEFLAGVTPLDYAFLPLDIRRYYSGSGTFDSAMADAIAVCGATGGIITLPRGTLSFANAIDMHLKVNIILQGQGGNSGGGSTGTVLSHTGTGPTFINMGSALGCWVKDCQILYTSASFSGTDALIRANNSDGNDNFQCGVERCIMGAITGSGCTHIALDGAICFVARDCHFIFGNPSISGRAAAGANYANAITFDNCVWSRTRLTGVLEAGEGWTFKGCTFEQTEAGAPSAVAIVTGIARGMSFLGCWFGDSTASGTWITYAGSGLVVEGNYISTNSGSNTTAIALANCDGAVIQGNQFDNFTNMVDFSAAGNTAVTFINNSWNSVTNVFSNVANMAPGSFVFNPNSPMVGNLTGIATFAQTGFFYNANGMLTNHGSSSVTVGTPLGVTFPKAFGTIWTVTTGLLGAPSTNNSVDLTSVTASGMTINLRGGAGSGVVHWTAQGI